MKKVICCVWLIILLLICNCLAALTQESFTSSASSSGTLNYLVSSHSRAFNRTLYMIPMRDSVRLATDVYLNTGQTQPHGAILMRTPYSKNWLALTGGNWANTGWPTIIQDMRGRFASEGVDTIFRNAHTDGPDTLAWIASQNWSNGKIATYGGSALGVNQYFMAGANPANLSCQYIKFATPDMHKHDIYQGGQFRKNMIEKWLKFQGSSYILPELWAHENYTLSYWTNVSLDGKWQNVNVPAIHIGGWYDCFSQGTIEGFSGYQYSGGPGARGKSKLIIGPWTHGGSGRINQGELNYPENSIDTISSNLFWEMVDQYTMNDAGDFDKWHNVSYYVMGDVDDPNAPGNKWRYSDVWPVPANETPFYFHSGNLLDPRIPVINNSLSYSYNPQNPVSTVGGQNLNLPSGPYDQTSIENRNDVLLFTTPPLTQPVEATGPIKARLYVSSDCVDTDFTVKLTDVYPDGRSMLINDGILRMRNRNGRDHWDLMTPDEIYEVEVDLWSTSYIWNTSHRIRVAISSSNYPRFLANPNTADGIYKNTTYNIAKNTLFMDNEHPSSIILPIVGSVMNEKPIIVPTIPSNTVMNENETHNFTMLVSDEDIMNLSFTWRIDDEVIIGWNESYYSYYADFNSSGKHVLNITVTDIGIPKIAAYYEANITVNNVNRLPRIISYYPDLQCSVNEIDNGLLNFTINAFDPDNDTLNYFWYLNNMEIANGTNVFSFNYNYNSAGNYKIEVRISDTIDEITQEWNLLVNHMNRAPIITNYSPKLECYQYETERGTVDLSIIAMDPDGDFLSYTWYVDSIKIEDLNRSLYKFSYNYKSAGEYEIKAVVNDTITETSLLWRLQIINTNRLPELKSYSPELNWWIIETESGILNFTASVTDPDNDLLNYSWYLNSVKLDTEKENEPCFSFYYNYKSAGNYKIQVIINDTKDEISLFWHLHVQNVNRAPIINLYSPNDQITINNTDSKPITFIITANDPDSEDTLNFKWHKDYLTLNGEKNNTFTYTPTSGEIGKYFIRVEVSDGNGGIAIKEWILRINRSFIAEENNEDQGKNDSQERVNDLTGLMIFGGMLIILIVIGILLILIFINQKRLRRTSIETDSFGETEAYQANTDSALAPPISTSTIPPMTKTTQVSTTPLPPLMVQPSVQPEIPSTLTAKPIDQPSLPPAQQSMQTTTKLCDLPETAEQNPQQPTVTQNSNATQPPAQPPMPPDSRPQPKL